jgi:hypothetical protein
MPRDEPCRRRTGDGNEQNEQKDFRFHKFQFVFCFSDRRLCAAEKIQDRLRAQKFRGAREHIRSAPAQGTLRAGKRENQISRAQSRA